MTAAGFKYYELNMEKPEINKDLPMEGSVIKHVKVARSLVFLMLHQLTPFYDIQALLSTKHCRKNEIGAVCAAPDEAAPVQN